MKKKVTRNKRTEAVAVECKHNGKMRDKKVISVAYSLHRPQVSLPYLSLN